MAAEWEHKFTNTNGIRMHYVTYGNGDLILLLHGFPEFWYSWRFQIGELGNYLHVVAPDLRGYNKTDKPKGVKNYKINLLLKDIYGLIENLGYQKAIIVGHDWGGALAWEFARTFPNVTEKLIVLNCPPIDILQEEIATNERQRKRSEYVFFFQQPEIPEKTLSDNNYAMLKYTWLSMATKKGKKIWDKETLDKYVEALRLPALSCGINYYRAAFLYPPRAKQRKLKVFCDTLVIWGEHDKALGKELTQHFPKIVKGNYLIKFIPEAGHWVQQEAPNLVNRYILEFLELI
ncbi:MAG: alpha/beta fold hydrolase [Candidatus Helarchaeota archaeon]